MAVPTRLRDMVHMERLVECGGIIIECERCRYPLTRPGKPGEPRNRGHVRSAWKVPPSGNGEQVKENVMLVCGECSQEWMKLAKYIVHVSQMRKWVEMWDEASDPWREHMAQNDDVSELVIPQVELSDDEKGMFEQELENMKAEEARIKEEEGREYGDEVIPSKKMDREAWVRGEEKFPEKDEVERS